MYCTRRVTDDLTWIGSNDRRLALFEGVYNIPKGVSYNSYILMDDVTVVFDTVDKAVSKVFFENIEHTLNGRKLDYIVVQHMEPDHSATLEELLYKYPETVVICNSKTEGMIKQFFNIDFKSNIVSEGDTFNTGHHEFTFVFAPMVHWPEVMVTYDSVSKMLFSADAFGTFGAINGALFADEVDFMHDFMDEARRYYCNIVGKYGVQVQNLLKKASSLDIQTICPLHGFVWRKDIGSYIDKYLKWSSYTPEENAVVIAYGSIYGNTENAAEIISCKLHDKGIKTVMFDVSVTPASEIIAAAFRYSHLIFASATYNSGIFLKMEDLLRDLVSHNIQKRTVALVQNGSWAPTCAKQMQEILEKCRNMTFLDNVLTIKSSVNESQEAEINALVNEVAESMK